MSIEPGTGAPGRKESPEERADRNFVELLQGLRVAVTGVQVLFAFLLTVPFSPNFASLSEVDRMWYIVALTAAAIASICYIAPAAQHRILFRQGVKEPLVRRSNVYGILGGVALVISMTSAWVLVVDYLYVGTLAAVLGAGLALFGGWAWFVQPLLTRRKSGSPS
ncbi:DUF6328 family protein [Thermopolyspora sp. NPDC052614]|uniref:DUF6328 family protein n=1 Tax=Thermopolyspora sp. NPDC052614 TaxID=3155682 RepID=UPI003425017F